MENGEAPTAEPKKLNAHQKARILEKGGKIFELVRKGKSWRQISKKLKQEAIDAGGKGRGFSHEQCRLDYNDYVDLLIEEGGQDIERYRMLLVARLDRIYENFQRYAEEKIDANSASNLVEMKKKAGDVLVKTVNTTADLLGVKRPQKVEVGGKDGGPIEVKQFVVEIVSDNSNGTSNESSDE